MSMNDYDIDPPKETAGDVGHTIVRAGLSAIPIVGGPAAELFSAIITPPLVRRRDAWVQSIAEGLHGLEKKIGNFSMESLATNEVFTTAVMHATQAALRDHRHEKLEALRNAVLNVAAGNAPSDDLQLMFLEFIDGATSWHIRLLSFFHNPQEYARANGVAIGGSSISQTTLSCFKELVGQKGFFEQLVRDLTARGFVDIDPGIIYAMMTPSGATSKRTTDLGDAFLRFIASPL
jgi:hypothetical protein